ncbi:MAG: glycogen/starch synthase [Candidatus Margulisiibacteriota bacterium]|nr:glycogen/starch synthase [Candidatus Margulisiibacteriota bacterium]
MRATRTNRRPLHIWMVTPEIPPLRTTGGLADAVHGLSKALVQRGHSVSVFVPSFTGTIERAIRDVHFRGQKVDIRPAPNLTMKLGHHPEVETWILSMDIPLGANRPEFIKYYFVDTKAGNWFGNRNRIYGYPDDASRFLFFDKVAADFYSRTQYEYTNGNRRITTPDLIHGHDWATGFLGYFLRHFDPKLKKLPFVYNVHNLTYTTPISMEDFRHLTGENNPWAYSTEGMEFFGRIDPHKAAFRFADRVVFVSPTYRKEAISGDVPMPAKLYDGLLQSIEERTRAVLNGIPDNYCVERFVENGSLPEKYSPDNLGGRMAARKLLAEVGQLNIDDNSLILSATGRWAEQKGTDATIAALHTLMKENPRLYFATVGSEAKGETYEERIRDLGSKFPNRVAIFGFDDDVSPILTRENLEALVLAGGSYLSMPSQFEPCGLGQLKALKLGLPVIANRTGGLADTIKDMSTGFHLGGSSVIHIIEGIRRASNVYQGDQEKYLEMSTQAMRQNNSWSRAAELYEAIYYEAIDLRADEA